MLIATGRRDITGAIMPAILRIFILLIAGSSALFASDIEGRVRAKGQGADVIKRATIQLLRDRIVIDEHFIGSDGRFEFRNLNRGSYMIRVRAEGYADEEVSVELLRPTSREMIPIDLKPLDDKRAEGPGGTISVTEYQIPRGARREYQQGLDDRKRGDCGKAVPHLQKAIAAFEKYGEAFNELGNCFKLMGEPGKAEDSFKMAVAYTGTIYPSINLADLYAGQKRFGDAHDVLRASIASHPSEGDLQFAVARLHFDQGRMKEAEQAGLEAHRRTHRMADVHLLLAKVYLSLQDYPSLISQLRLYLDEDPKGAMADRVRKNLEELRVPR